MIVEFFLNTILFRIEPLPVISIDDSYYDCWFQSAIFWYVRDFKRDKHVLVTLMNHNEFDLSGLR